MPQSISQQLNEVFQQASISYVQNMLRTDQDRAEFETINRRAAENQEDLTRLYHEEYDTRVDAARARLYDKAAQSRLDHPPPPGGETDRATVIDREAHREVRLAHEADLQRSRDEAQQAFEDLLDRAHRRNQVKGMAVEAFLRVAERRSGQDRRIQRHQG